LLKRVKRRYLVVKVDSAEVVGETELLAAVWQSIMKLYGEYGASKAALKMINYDAGEKTAVLRTANDALEITRAAIAAITKIGNKPAGLHVAKVSGTIRSLRMQKRKEN
jgi:ribonuclease P/MRP protein subunit POP5